MAEPLDRIADDRLRLALERIRGWEGEILPASDLRDLVPGFRAFKGIYKPASSPYALWVRQTARGTYADIQPEFQNDGSWTYLYAAESQEGRSDTDLATNRGLLKCRDDHIPVGVFRQVESRGGRTEYRVLGLGYIESFDGGHFRIRGEPIVETQDPLPGGVVAPFRPFDPSPLPVHSVVRTLRERRFGSLIRELYHEKCSLCEVGYRVRGRPVGLEAAHLIPVESNGVLGDLRNGILLCSNHHKLFDASAWVFDQNYEVILSRDEDFRRSAVANHLLGWEGKKLPNLPSSELNYPASDAISWRLDYFRGHQ